MIVARYAHYRDSGTEWLGEVPSHWPTKRLRFVADLNPSKAEAADLGDTEEVSFLPMESVGEDGTLDLSQTRPIGEIRNGYTYFANGDVVFAKVTPCLENGKGALIAGLLGGRGFGTTELTVLRPHDLANGPFLRWLTSSRVFRGPAEGEMIGAGGLKRVPDDFVANFLTAWPPLQEREAIVVFLDRETAKIDALVEEQRQLIELLKEKRQAVISCAVTKGLDSSVRMKDSGVEWLGEVPSHWTVTRLKQLVSSIEQGWSPQCASWPVEGPHQWGVLKVGCVNGGVFRPEENKALPAGLTPMPELSIMRDDLLISRANTRELVGSAAAAEENFSNLLLCDKLYRLRFLSKAYCSKLAAAFLATPGARAQIELAATGASSSMLNIGQDTILNIEVPVPPLSEQHEIIRSIDEEKARLDALTASAASAIALLQERRAALISAAVTGKIDVRGLAADDADAEAA